MKKIFKYPHTALVIGLGRSGAAAARALFAGGGQVIATDISAELTPAAKELQQLGVRVVLGSHPTELLQNCSLIVLSPGISPLIPIIMAATNLGIPIISEVELGFRMTMATVIGITGTNGKTTTTTLLNHILVTAGRKSQAVGNIGVPISSVAASCGAADTLVCELSSYQLEKITTFAPKIGLLLNIAPDHLDRYHDMDDYLGAKLRLFHNSGTQAVLNGDDPVLRDSVRHKYPNAYLFSAHKAPRRGIFCDQSGYYWCHTSERTFIMPQSAVKLPGAHNRENVMAALAVAMLMQIPIPAICQAVQSFCGLADRLEQVATIGDISYYNDSKATNVAALKRALEAFPDRKIVLIAGGEPKGDDFGELAELFSHQVRSAILIGAAQGLIQQQLADYASFALAQNMDEAVQSATISAQPGDIVLLSPGCASFDMYQDYKARGIAFRQAVGAISTLQGSVDNETK